MKFQRSTLVLMLLAICIAGAVYFYESTVVPSQQEAKAKQKEILNLDEDQVQSLTVTTKDKSLRFDRSAIAGEPQPEQPVWVMEILQGRSPTREKPATGSQAGQEGTSATPETEENRSTIPSTYPANEAYVSFLLSELVKGKSDRTVIATPQQRRDYGLETPMATVEVTLKNGETHKVILGGRDFTGSSLYAQVDPPAETTGEQPVLLVSTNFENAVDRPLEEWIQTAEETGSGEGKNSENTAGEGEVNTPPEALPEPTSSPESSAEDAAESSPESSPEPTEETSPESLEQPAPTDSP